MTYFRLIIVVALISEIIFVAETLGLESAAYVVLGVVLFGAYLKSEGYE